MIKIENTIDTLVRMTGRTTSWLTVILVLLVAGDVLFRYIWHVSSVAEQELEWHVLAVMALLGASYNFQQGEYVRVDIFYHKYSTCVKRWMDIFIPALIIVPMMMFIVWQSLPFVFMSWDILETSPNPGGLPGRYLIKAFVPIGFSLIALQGIAMTIQGIKQLNVAEVTENA